MTLYDHPHPKPSIGAVLPGQAQASAQGQEGLALKVLCSVGQQKLLQRLIPFSHLSFPHWQTAAYIFISCQIRVSCGRLQVEDQMVLGPGEG